MEKESYFVKVLIITNCEFWGCCQKFFALKVEKIEHAIGITGISSSRKRDVNFLSIDAMDPSYKNIASGKYPFFRPLYLVIHNSVKGQQIIKGQKTVILADALGLMDKFNRRMESLGVKNWK